MARTSLPPGFRFHPTDVELVMYHLKRKVTGKNVTFEVIAELNICKYAPWDLPDKSCLGSRDLEWYFFCPKETKYANGARMNRATDCGYWKSTGKDRPVSYNNRTVGMVKTLVFHIGHAPKGQRTDWVMHEYRMQDEELAAGGVVQDVYVLCKVFQKSGPGPRNGAQYGAPFNEDDYDNDGEFIAPDALPPPALPSNNSGFLTGRTSSGPLCSSVIFPGSTSSGHLSDSAFVPGSTLSDSVFVPGSTSAGPLPDTGLSGAMPFADEVPAQGPMPTIPDDSENIVSMLERIIPEQDSLPPLHENGNNEVENFGHVNQNNGLASSDANFIFEGLMDLDNSPWTPGIGFAGGFLELNDLSDQLFPPAHDMGSQLYPLWASDNSFQPNYGTINSVGSVQFDSALNQPSLLPDASNGSGNEHAVEFRDRGQLGYLSDDWNHHQ